MTFAFFRLERLLLSRPLAIPQTTLLLLLHTNKMSSKPNIVIVGAGLSGITLAIELQKRGVHSYTIYEKNRDVGGTWRVNTYPNCACDVPSHCSWAWSAVAEALADLLRRFSCRVLAFDGAQP